MRTILIFVIFCLFGHLCFVKSKKAKVPKMFTSKTEMEKMVETEKKLYEVLHNYTVHLESRTEKLKRFHEEFRTALAKASNGVEGYLDNPISSFLFTRRLLVTWKEVESIMTGDVGKAWNRDLKVKKLLADIPLPSAKELEYAANQVKKLQMQYQLNATEMANGSPYGISLNSGDCFELGREAYEDEDFDRANDWLHEALRRVDDGRGKLEDITEYLAATAYLQGRLRKALELTEKLLEIAPDLSTKAENNVKYYKKMIADIEKKKSEAEKLNLVPDVLNWLREDLDNFTQRICDNEVVVSDVVSRKLKCRLVHRGVPFLYLARLKEEVLFQEPRVVMYHDMLSDVDIEDMISAASVRSLAYGKDSNLISHASSALLPDSSNKAVATAVRHAGDMSGFDTNYADMLQVLRYDINGTMKPHFDRQEPSSVVVRKSGNKLATIQYFLNDSDGGATVFPALKLAVEPRKGSALLWLNLKQNGQSNDLTMHGTCPVRSGQHWQAVKWLRTFGNEFIMPCGKSQIM